MAKNAATQPEENKTTKPAENKPVIVEVIVEKTLIYNGKVYLKGDKFKVTDDIADGFMDRQLVKLPE
jgi:hypothetical protein